MLNYKFSIKVPSKKVEEAVSSGNNQLITKVAKMYNEMMDILVLMFPQGMMKRGKTPDEMVFTVVKKLSKEEVDVIYRIVNILNNMCEAMEIWTREQSQTND